MMFAGLLVIHILAGLTCVITGVVAMVSPKRPGRHPRFGAVFYGAISLLFATATGMAAMRWSRDYQLFLIAAAAFGSASVGYAARKIRWKGWITFHISGMGLSYVALLTGFYVDNGPSLPVWKLLPHLTYWLLPGAIGVPLILRALVRWGGRTGRYAAQDQGAGRQPGLPTWRRPRRPVPPARDSAHPRQGRLP